MKTIDIVVTWPRSRSLETYLASLEAARAHSQLINYRVHSVPHWEDGALDARHARCYRVHTGRVRGYCNILYTAFREDGEVDGWPAGHYIVCSPIWHALRKSEQVAMEGFRGWRWFTP